MQQVHVTILATFCEMLVLVVSVSGFLLILAEYVRRRTEDLLLGAAAFFSFSLGAFAYFLAQLLSANDIHSAGTVRSSFAFIAAGGFILCLNRSRSTVGRWRAAIVTVSFAVTAYALYLIASAPVEHVQVVGITFGELSRLAMSFSFVPLLIYSLCGLVRKPEANPLPPAGGPGTRFANVSIPVAVAALAAAALAGARELTVPLLLLLAVALGLSALRVAADHHDDEGIRGRLFQVLGQNVLVRSQLFAGLAFLAVGNVALFAAMPSHVGRAEASRETFAERELGHFAATYEARATGLLDNARGLAGTVGTVGEDGAIDAWRNGTANATRAVRVVDAGGIVTRSTVGDDDVGTNAGGGIVAAALAGTPSVGMERLSPGGSWAILAAVPLVTDGNTAGAVVVSDVDRSFVADLDSLLGRVSGAGVAVGDDVVISVGGRPDAAALAAFRAEAYADGQSWHVRLSDAVPVPAPMLYAFVVKRHVDAEAFRMIATVELVLLAAMAFVAVSYAHALGGILAALRRARAEASLVGARADAAVGQTAAAEALLRERQDFLDHAVSELQVPAASAAATIDALRFGEAGRLSGEQLTMVERLRQQTSRIARLTGNLRDVSALSGGAVRPKRTAFSLEDVLDDVAGELTVVAREKGIDLRWRRGGTLLPRVSADREHVQKSLYNVLRNAVQYSRYKGTVDVAVVREPGRPGAPGKVAVTVADDGIGIPKDEVGRTFSLFHRASNAAGSEGAGLGLYLARKFLELNGGAIRLESQEGRGTTVTVSLPVAENL